MTYALILTMITSFGAIRRSKRRKAIEEPPTGGFSHFQTPGIAPNEKPRHGDRGVMFGAPLVLHGQDQDGKSVFIGSVFSVGSFHHRCDTKPMKQTFGS
jgi:hypothetical protein